MPALSTTRPLVLVCLLTNELLNSLESHGVASVDEDRMLRVELSLQEVLLNGHLQPGE